MTSERYLPRHSWKIPLSLSEVSDWAFLNSDTETSDSKYHDALLEVQSQLQKIAAEFNIEFPENYPATPTIRKDLETLRR
jgi:hypothetical protein